MPPGPAYVVTNVTLRLGAYYGDDPLSHFEFRADAGTGNPGVEVVGTLITPSKTSTNRENYSYKPSGTIILQPSTKYWLFGNINYPVFWSASSGAIQYTGIATCGTGRYDRYGTWLDWGNPAFQIDAVPAPRAVIRASQVEICWSSISNLAYMVQFRSALTTNQWTALFPSNIVATTSETCVEDPIILGSPSRYYRIIPVIP